MSHFRKDSKENSYGSAGTGDEDLLEVETNAERFEPPKLSQEKLIATDRNHIKKQRKLNAEKKLPQKRKEVRKCVVIQDIIKESVGVTRALHDYFSHRLLMSRRGQ